MVRVILNDKEVDTSKITIPEEIVRKILSVIDK